MEFLFVGVKGYRVFPWNIKKLDMYCWYRQI